MALPLPPEPDTSTLVLHLREYERALQAHDAETMIIMAERWAQLENILEAQISLLAREMLEKQAAGEEIGINQLLKFERYQTLLEQMDVEMRKYNEWAVPEISGRQHFLGRLGLTHSAEAIQVGLSDAGFGMGQFFNRLPVSSVEIMVGMTGAGAPLGDLLQEAYPLSAEHMTNALLEGVAYGLPPRETARRMMDAMAGGLAHITTIARTEQLRVYREASRRQYEASGAVQEYERVCAKQPKTCIACIALDGTIYLVQDLMEVHPNDRCFMIPLVAGAGRTDRELARDWFAKQDPELQKEMLGPGRFDLYQRGLGLQDMVTKSVHPIWGPSLGITPLKDLRAAGLADLPPLEPIGPLSISERMLTADLEYDPVATRSVGGITESYRVGVGEGQEVILKPGGYQWAQTVDAEVFANRLSDELGFGIVPPTVRREAGTYKRPDGSVAQVEASMQQWIFNGVTGYDVDFATIDERSYSQMVLMDTLTNNWDRHGTNWLTVDDQVVAIDNALMLKDAKIDEFHNATFGYGVHQFLIPGESDLLRFDVVDIDAIAGLLDNEEFMDSFMETFEPSKWEAFEYQARVLVHNRDQLIEGLGFDFVIEEL